jgi:hypothetical protein
MISVTCALAFQQVSGVKRNGEDFNRGETVKMLNASLAVYLQNGGSISHEATGDVILANLKKKVAEGTPGTFVGARGPFVDVRLKGIPVDLESKSQRIVWDSGKRQFSTSTQGPGWSRLSLDDLEGVASHGTEARRSMLSFAAESRWVWDYKDNGAGRRAPRSIPTANPSPSQLLPPEDPLPLDPPVINPFSGVFNHHAFPLSLTITNPNPPGLSNTLYQINGGEWKAWQGGQSPVEKSLVTTVAAFAQGRELNTTDSNIVTETYTTYFIRGQAAGAFVDQAGDKQFVYSLSGGGATLSWGKTESAGQSVSSLQLVPDTVFEAGEGESFTLGKLHYTNGVTRAGTNAQTASLRLDLALSIPAAGTVSLNLPVRMLNTIHYPWTTAGDCVDYLWVPRQTTLSQAVTVLDRQFRITITAGADSAVVEGTEIKVPISENNGADVSLIATLTALN